MRILINVQDCLPDDKIVAWALGPDDVFIEHGVTWTADRVEHGVCFYRERNPDGSFRTIPFNDPSEECWALVDRVDTGPSET